MSASSPICLDGSTPPRAAAADFDFSDDISDDDSPHEGTHLHPKVPVPPRAADKSLSEQLAAVKATSLLYDGDENVVSDKNIVIYGMGSVNLDGSKVQAGLIRRVFLS